MALELRVEATAEPITIDEVRQYLRLSTSDTSENALLNSWIKAMRQLAENITQRQLMPATWELILDAFPVSGIELPRGPLSTDSTDVVITYLDSSGSTQILSATAYTVDYETDPGIVTPSYGNVWPETQDFINAVRITYISGYYTTSATASDAVPDAIKTWIKMRIGTIYENREAVAIDRNFLVQELPRSFVDGLLDPYILIKVV